MRKSIIEIIKRLLENSPKTKPIGPGKKRPGPGKKRPGPRTPPKIIRNNKK